MTARPLQSETLRDLRGALGDLLWAVHAWSEPEAPVADVLIAAWDHEYLVQRLLLSGFRLKTATGPASTWLTPAGATVRTFESQAAWVFEALRAAAGNRDGDGTPHMPPAFVVAGLVLEATYDGDLADGLIRTLSKEQIEQARSIVSRLDLGSLPHFERLLDQANTD